MVDTTTSNPGIIANRLMMAIVGIEVADYYSYTDLVMWAKMEKENSEALVNFITAIRAEYEKKD